MFILLSWNGICGDDKLDATPNTLRSMIERYTADSESLERFYAVSISGVRVKRFNEFYRQWLGTLSQLSFDTLSHDDRIDYLLFKNHLNREQRQLDIDSKALTEQLPLIPFAQTISDLEDTRRDMEWIEASRAASVLTSMNKQIAETQKSLESKLKRDGKQSSLSVKKTVANRTAQTIQGLRNALKRWYTFYNGYDPLFTWWTAEPYKTVDQSLKVYAAFLKETIVGVKADDDTTIIGDPIGRDALLSELVYEMVPYTPDELVEIANKEFLWCEKEMKLAANELGFGDDWRKALDHVKSLYVEPGKQPELVKNLALEAIAFLDDHKLVTIPQLARETWRMEMLTPEQQLVSPFFLGGETILVSFPTSTMSHEQKMMSMRGNNIHFARAVVHHELIPGHHLQGFMNERYKSYRRIFYTPFWTEGWAFYWEMLLWDLNFAKSAENRVGMLFWRMHRCARIIFSLSFHLEKMTPQQCVDFLVERVGHERANATAEVRRSFGGGYGPLYQCAYMLGALQFRSLHRELVDTGKMTDQSFHDAILKENNIPVEMVRSILINQPLTKDFSSSWRFYDSKENLR